MRLCADYEISADRPFNFNVNSRRIDCFDALGTGQTIVHEVSPPHIDQDNSGGEQPDGDSEDNPDPCSPSQVEDENWEGCSSSSQHVDLLRKQVNFT